MNLKNVVIISSNKFWCLNEAGLTENCCQRIDTSFHPRALLAACDKLGRCTGTSLVHSARLQDCKGCGVWADEGETYPHIVLWRRRRFLLLLLSLLVPLILLVLVLLHLLLLNSRQQKTNKNVARGKTRHVLYVPWNRSTQRWLTSVYHPVVSSTYNINDRSPPPYRTQAFIPPPPPPLQLSFPCLNFIISFLPTSKNVVAPAVLPSPS